MWVKQRNYYSQMLLEKWVEPFTTWASLIVGDGVTAIAGEKPQVAVAHMIDNPVPLIRYLWRKLMENHPHDSICGCSIDQVHNEMRFRFEQVDQIAEELSRQALTTIAEEVDTRFPDGSHSWLNSDLKSALMVFNPLAAARTDVVTVNLQGAAAVGEVQIIDETGKTLPHTELKSNSREITSMCLNRDGLRDMSNIIATGRVEGMVLQDVGFHRLVERHKGLIDVIMNSSGEPSRDALKYGAEGVEQFLSDDSLSSFDIRVLTSAVKTIQFVAKDVPACGYRTFWLRSVIPRFDSRSQDIRSSIEADQNGLEQEIQNKYLRVVINPVNGTLTVIDKNTGAVFEKLNYFEDGGDAGDEYNYSPPEKDTLITSDQAVIRSIRVVKAPHQQSLEFQLTLPVPESLSDDRLHRAKKNVALDISNIATLYNDVPRLDIVAKVNNLAQDHRLRVHFPVPFKAIYADYDGHFEVLKRPIALPDYDESWIEQPRPETPQRAFVDISKSGIGLMIANRGLPEVAVIPAEADKTVIALTLLRCVGWLSRDDFSTRKGHAGPMLATPQAQMLGEYTFEYSIIPHMNDWQQAYQQAYAYNASMRGIGIDIHKGRLPFALSFITIEPDDFILTAIKIPEDDSGLLVRGYNPGEDSLKVRLTLFRRFTSAGCLDLAEQELSPLPLVKDCSVVFTSNPKEIATIKFS
ncbi:MAG: glycosyl hydrolase-related protein [Anaerolineales bacterium]|nr:glycosyl hydrolase-related protein [Anaerolineales bacterium]